MKNSEIDSQEVIRKALKDNAFKEKLLANPKEAIQEEFRLDIPDDVEVKVLENTAKTLYIVVPYSSSEEFSDEELKAVAGGGMPPIGLGLKAKLERERLEAEKKKAQGGQG